MRVEDDLSALSSPSRGALMVSTLCAAAALWAAPVWANPVPMPRGGIHHERPPEPPRTWEPPPPEELGDPDPECTPAREQARGWGECRLCEPAPPPTAPNQPPAPDPEERRCDTLAGQGFTRRRCVAPGPQRVVCRAQAPATKPDESAHGCSILVAGKGGALGGAWVTVAVFAGLLVFRRRARRQSGAPCLT